MFNTLKYAKILQEAGFSREQSEATIHILAEVMEDKLATKHDIQELRASTKHDIEELRAATKHDIEELRASTQHEIRQLRSDLIIKMGAMQAAAVGLVVTLIKLL